MLPYSDQFLFVFQKSFIQQNKIVDHLIPAIHSYFPNSFIACSSTSHFSCQSIIGFNPPPHVNILHFILIKIWRYIFFDLPESFCKFFPPNPCNFFSVYHTFMICKLMDFNLFPLTSFRNSRTARLEAVPKPVALIRYSYSFG